MATSIKIDDELKGRVQHLADLRQRSAHWIMRDAITQYVASEEARESFKHEAILSGAAYQVTGQHLTGREAQFYFERAISLPEGAPVRVEYIAALAHLAGRLARFHLMYPSCAMTHALHRGQLLLAPGKPDPTMRHYSIARSPCIFRRASAQPLHAAEARRLFESVGAHGALARIANC